jgi:peptidylprolyl isomerase
VRRLLALLALLPLLLLSACGGESPAPASTGSESLDGVKVTGAAGAKPEITFDAPMNAASTQRTVVSEGDGAPIARGQKVSVEYIGVNGKDGKQFDASQWADQPVSFTLGDQVIPGFVTGLEGVKVGSRVLVAVAPADGYGPQGGVPDAGIGEKDTLLFVIDVKDARTVLARAEGEPVPPGPGLPTVALGENGAPTVTLPEGPAPADLVVQPLITGGGAKVQQGQNITVHYTGVKWPGGEVFDSSWDKGAPVDFPIGTGAVIPGWDAGLVDQTVGSQVLLVIPPAQGYGEQGQPSAGISGTDTLVFVVDILDAA